MEKEALRQAWTNKMDVREPNLKMVNFCIDNGGKVQTIDVQRLDHRTLTEGRQCGEASIW